MSDDFEELLKRWLRDRAGNDRSALRALAGNVAALPPRRRRRPSALLSLAASVLVVVGLAALALSRQPGFGGVAATPAETTQGGATLPGGPERYAGDPRLTQCFGTADMQYVFEMVHARDYQRYLPRMLLAPELDVYDSAFVMVYRDGWQGPPMLGMPDGQRPTPIPGRRFVCIVVAGGPPTLYSDVDITGLTVAVTPSETNGAVPPTAPTLAPPTPQVASPSTTPEPAPAWVADLAGQLACDGPVANLGGEYPDNGGWPDRAGDTAEATLALFLGPGNPYASLPTAGFTLLHAEPHWASFAHIVVGRAKAIVLLSDAMNMGPGWLVVGLRACDASEFDPAVPLTFPVTIWKDSSGKAVSTETIRSFPGPGHCGWDSAVWLNVGGNVYFRDPQGVMGEWTKTKFEPHAQLPPSATDSGYRSGKWSLWLDPGKDAYLVFNGTVERWPRSLDPQIGCA